MRWGILLFLFLFLLNGCAYPIALDPRDPNIDLYSASVDTSRA